MYDGVTLADEAFEPPSSIIPKSAIRYRDYPDVHTESGRASANARSYSDERPSRATSKHPVPPRRSVAPDDEPPVSIVPRRSSSSRSLIEREERQTETLPGRRPHWLVFVGIALFIMVLGWVVLTSVANWWQNTTNNMQYGYPRTQQVDWVVGHNDSASNPSHFIAINLNSHIEIIEFPGGDTSKAKIYVGPTLIGPNSNLAPVTLTFADVNGDGKVDMIVNVQGGHFVFINQNGQFRPAQPGDTVHLPSQ